MRNRLLLLVVALAACTVTGGRNGPTDAPEDGPDPVTSAKGSSQIVAVAAGREHTCALRESGEVTCWGRGGLGQLGTGAFDDKPAPSQVVGLTDATALSAGDDHTCALRRTGAVTCWGSNDRGQLGSGQGGEGMKRARAEAVTNIEDVVEVVSGSRHTCARTREGQVSCWGDNVDGQLGSKSPAFSGAPVWVQGLADASMLALGQRHSCALRAGGKAICWGANDRGQLGDGSKRGHERPGPVKNLAGATMLVAGGDRTCAANAATVVCWGRNGKDDLAVPTAVPGLEGTAGLAVAPEHACAWDRGGRARCWGENHDGRLGDGTRTRRPSPVPTSALAGVRSMATGHRHACAALRDGNVQCWGDATSGATATSGEARPEPGQPVRTFDIDDAIALSSGLDFSCAARKSGQVACWGKNDVGQLGPGATTEQSEEPVLVTGIGDAIDVAAGLTHACAVRRNGQVACWGKNDVGQLGANAGRKTSGTVRVEGIDDAVAVAAGHAHSCAVRRSGQVRCWGSDEHEQLGDGAGKRGGVVVGLADAVEITAGERHTCARRRTNEVVCWGSNKEGQLGNGAGAAELKLAMSSPVVVQRVTAAVEVSAGRAFTCVRKADGTVACWGDNTRSQLGSGTQSAVWTTRVPAKNVAGARALGLGHDHACVAMGGRIGCWGAGGLALGAGAGALEPILRSGPDLEAVEIAAGPRHTCVRQSAGTVACFGERDSGQLGDGARQVLVVPTPVQGL